MRLSRLPRNASAAWFLGLLLASGASALPAPAAAAQEASVDAPLRYVRVAARDARIRNLADDKGIAIASPGVGDVLAVHKEISAGWLLVERPGGYSVWVYGQFLAATGEADVYEVTANAVQIRPGPSRDVTNFPLPQRLHAGDRVRLIEPLDADKPLGETWARIWSPPGVRAWIRANQTEPLASGEDGAALWDQALATLPVARPVPSVGRPAPAVTIRPAEEAKGERAQAALERELEAARTFLREESKKDAPDVVSARRLFQALLEKSPPAAVARSARDGLAQVDVLQEAAELKAQMERERALRREEVLERQRQVWEASRSKDPLGEVFLARGVLFRRQEHGQTPRYYLRFGGRTVAEVVCSSGRYGLEIYAGYEVGVTGDEDTETVKDPSAPVVPIRKGSEPATQRRIPRIDVRRLEIIQRR